MCFLGAETSSTKDNNRKRRCNITQQIETLNSVLPTINKEQQQQQNDKLPTAIIGDNQTASQNSSTETDIDADVEAVDDPVDLTVDQSDPCSKSIEPWPSPVTSPEVQLSNKTCPHCLRKFTLVSSLRRHLLTHTDRRPYKCQFCEKSFTLPSYLREHQRTHGIGQLLNCPYCDKTFNKPRRLLYHVRTHTGEKPYVCKFCDRRFPQPNGLEIHVRTHTGAKRFKCGECGKMFSQSSNLTTHIKRHMKMANSVNENGQKAETANSLCGVTNELLNSKLDDKDLGSCDKIDERPIVDDTDDDNLIRCDNNESLLFVIKPETGSEG
jgi:uncharacterized C2H2 Zn-finger protein